MRVVLYRLILSLANSCPTTDVIKDAHEQVLDL